MIFLSLLWLFMGLLIGAIARAAQIHPAAWKQHTWVSMLTTGAIAASCGGWIGVLLLGRYFATAMALWVAVAGIVSVCWGVSRISHQ
ncbi:MAG TPA: hypothetical protein VFB12_32365 [Ktedonobacteraceae bacterium]|nr:hypothetical protein [Ktedonobacteraceae bacterium]